MTSKTPSSTSLDNSTAYINGQIYTINSFEPWASGFIVSPDGTFTHVGSTSEIRSFAERSGLVIVNLGEQFVMPGIHDAHTHLLFSAVALTSAANIGFDSTHEDIADRTHKGSCRCEYVNAYQDWIMAGVYNNDGFPDGIADRKYLDSKFPDRPVVIMGGAAHAKLANTEALRRAGYDLENEPDIQGSRYFRRPDGSLTGELGENAMTKIALAMPRPSLGHVKRTLRQAINLCHQFGITSVQEASANTLLLHALQELDAEGKLSIDIAAHIVYGPEWLGEESTASLHTLLDKAEEYKSKHIDTNFVKMMLDGVPLPPLFSHCALDEHGQYEKSKILTPNIVEAVKKYDERGMTIKVHCTGHGSTRLALDAFEEVRKNNPNGPRHEIAHCSGTHDADYKRFRPLNITAEMSPADFFVHPVTSASNGLMDWNWPKMLAANAHLTIGSDWGAAPDPSLFPAMAKIVETVGNGSKQQGGEMLCRMLTMNGAESVGKERNAGSIEVGKKANFIVVDRDLSKGLFDGAKVLRTYFEGECVWKAGP